MSVLQKLTEGIVNRNLQKEGDLIEAGVFRGYTLLAVALFLKEKNQIRKFMVMTVLRAFLQSIMKMIHWKNLKIYIVKVRFRKNTISKFSHLRRFAN